MTDKEMKDILKNWSRVLNGEMYGRNDPMWKELLTWFDAHDRQGAVLVRSFLDTQHKLGEYLKSREV